MSVLDYQVLLGNNKEIQIVMSLTLLRLNIMVICHDTPSSSSHSLNHLYVETDF